MSGAPPRLTRILETVLYCPDAQRAEMERFYDDVLGLGDRKIGGFGYRLGPAVLLIFDAEKAAVQDSPPAHGTTGRAHTCFVCGSGTYDVWKARIADSGIDVIEEIEWSPPLRGRSFYFHDPAGHVLEIADRDIWPGAED
ncbi:VOC family protein [bacterium]|nr:VOC family protein [bacterium]